MLKRIKRKIIRPFKKTRNKQTSRMTVQKATKAVVKQYGDVLMRLKDN